MPSFVRNSANTQRWNGDDVLPVATMFRFDFWCFGARHVIHKKGSSLAPLFSFKASRGQIDVVIFHQSADSKGDDARKARGLTWDES